MTPEELTRDWLHGAGFEGDLQAAAIHVSKVENLLGTNWINDYLSGWGEFDRGGRWVHTLLQLARLGELLALAESGLRFQSAVVKRLQNSLQDLSSVWSELLGAEAFLRAGMPVEWAPPVMADTRRRVADFAASAGGIRVMAEVVRPSSSDAQRAAGRLMERLVSAVDDLPSGWQCTLALRRIPDATQESELREAIARGAAAARGDLVVPGQTIGEHAYLEVAPEVTGLISDSGQRFVRGFGPLLFLSHWLGRVSSFLAAPRVFFCGVAFNDQRAPSRLRKFAHSG